MQKVLSKPTEKNYTKEELDIIAESTLNSYPIKGKVLIAVGTLNNIKLAQSLYLHTQKKEVDVNILFTNQEMFNNEKNYLNIPKNKLYIYNHTIKFTSYDILIDAIGKNQLSNIENEIIEKMNQSNKPIISIDINSGLNPYNGLAKTCIHSTLTISIGGLKPGHLLNMAKDNIDKLINVNLEKDTNEKYYYLLEEADFKNFIPKRLNYSHKGSYGLVGILGGSIKYSGSVKLASLSLSALASGAGVSRIIIPSSISQSLLLYTLESTIFPIEDVNGQMIFNEEKINQSLKNVTALLIGIGWDQNKNNEQILNYILNNYNIPIVLDADGLNILAHTKKLTSNLILTPHLKEFSRLTELEISKITENPIDIAKEYAKKHNIILLLKGPTTIVTDGNKVYLIDKGSAGMATAGSGDVLSGILIGLLGYKKTDIKTVAFAAYINGLAGEIAQKKKGSVSMLARDTIGCLSDAIKLYIKK